MHLECNVRILFCRVARAYANEIYLPVAYKSDSNLEAANKTQIK